MLIMILLLANVYQHYANTPPETTAFPKPRVLPMQNTTSAFQVKLQQAIDSAKGHVLILTDTSYNTPILINGPLSIKNDTLLIKAKGKIILKCDTGFNGPAFSLTQGCKSIALDSLTIIGFKVGIASYGNALQIKNIYFENCPVQVQNSWALPSKKYVSGHLPGAIFSADSLPHNIKAK